MIAWFGPVATLAFAVLSTVLAVRLGHVPEAKRVHLFETDAGERATPFEGPSTDRSTAPVACRGCGAALESRSFRYCGSCALIGVESD